MTEASKIFFTTAELATRWAQSMRTLEGWRCAGTGPNYHKIGSSVRYHIADIERFERAWTSHFNDTS
ncbi:MAG: helix-turn-helix transcriptional regulator [Tsuneonella sp.]